MRSSASVTVLGYTTRPVWPRWKVRTRRRMQTNACLTIVGKLPEMWHCIRISQTLRVLNKQTVLRKRRIHLHCHPWTWLMSFPRKSAISSVCAIWEWASMQRICSVCPQWRLSAVRIICTARDLKSRWTPYSKLKSIMMNIFRLICVGACCLLWCCRVATSGYHSWGADQKGRFAFNPKWSWRRSLWCLFTVAVGGTLRTRAFFLVLGGDGTIFGLLWKRWGNSLIELPLWWQSCERRFRGCVDTNV
mgnify:CR=1 FL=1